MADKNNDKRGIYHNNEASDKGVIFDERSGVAVHESMVTDFSSQIAAAEAAAGDDTNAGGVEATDSGATAASKADTKSRK